MSVAAAQSCTNQVGAEIPNATKELAGEIFKGVLACLGINPKSMRSVSYQDLEP
jgi:hypothetical protein